MNNDDTNVVPNMFGFDSITDPIKESRKGAELLSRAIRTSAEIRGGIHKWVHQTALSFNDPENSIAATRKWLSWLKSEILDYLLSEESGSYQLSRTDLPSMDISEMKITGNGNFANAVKRVRNAMELGADLREVSTVSACEKWYREHKAEIEKQRRKQTAIEQTKAALEKRGVDPESEEGQRMLNREVSLILGGKDDDDADSDGASEPDEIDEVVKSFEAVLRETAEHFGVKYAANQGQDKVTSLETSLRKALQKLASDAGVIDQQSA